MLRINNLKIRKDLTEKEIFEFAISKFHINKNDIINIFIIKVNNIFFILCTISPSFPSINNYIVFFFIFQLFFTILLILLHFFYFRQCFLSK